MDKEKISLKKDKFKSARGGHSRLLDISCRNCGNLILVYQKDGPGNLRRLYMDRVLSPEKLVGLGEKDIDDIAMLRCEECEGIVATPYIYIKEKRKAFRLHPDAITRRIHK